MRTWRMRTTLVGQLRWLRDSFELWQCFFVVVFVFFQYYSPWFVFKRLSRCISSLKILLAAKGGELTRLWVCGQGDLELQQVFCFAEASLHLRSFSDHLCGREWPQWLSGVWSCLIDLCLVYSCQFEWTRTCLLRRKKRCLLRYSLVGADYQMTNVSEGRGKHCKIKTKYLGQSEVLHWF